MLTIGDPSPPNSREALGPTQRPALVAWGLWEGGRAEGWQLPTHLREGGWFRVLLRQTC